MHSTWDAVTSVSNAWTWDRALSKESKQNSAVIMEEKILYFTGRSIEKKYTHYAIYFKWNPHNFGAFKTNSLDILLSILFWSFLSEITLIVSVSLSERLLLFQPTKRLIFTNKKIIIHQPSGRRQYSVLFLYWQVHLLKTDSNGSCHVTQAT